MLRTSAARSREALMSASDNLSTKCSGFFLRSSSPIRPTRARHLYSVDSTAAFSFASRLPNLSDMVHSEIGAVAMTLTIYTCWLTEILSRRYGRRLRHSSVLACPGLILGAVAFSAGGDGGRKAPELSAQ